MQLDLNLLLALDALLEEESVTGAAERLHLSVPAMSRTLGRLRRATGDEVLVRTGRTMRPTPYALAVREEVHAVLARATAVLTPEHEVSPADLERTFAVRLHDAIAVAFGPELISAVAAEAPGVQLRLLAETSTDTGELRDGRIDLEIGAGGPATSGVSTRTVAHDRLVVIGRRDHPALADGPPTLDAYAAAGHVTVSRRGRLRDPIDDALAQRGISRRVVAAAPTSATALSIAARSDLLVAGPERMCRLSIDALGLRTRDLPVETAPVPVTYAWPQRYDADPAHRWLRGHVHRALELVTGTS